MKYTLEKKRELIDARPANQDISTYCNDIGISKASYYNWLKEAKRLAYKDKDKFQELMKTNKYKSLTFKLF